MRGDDSSPDQSQGWLESKLLRDIVFIAVLRVDPLDDVGIVTKQRASFVRQSRPHSVTQKLLTSR